MEKQKILLLGATGRTGKWALQEALAQGYTVHCLARNASRIQPTDGLKVFEGNTTGRVDLERAIEGCTSVISILNISRTSDFPWARLRTPKTLLSDTMRELIPLATAHGVRRVVVCSAWGVGDTRQHIPGWFRWFIDNSNIGAAYRDHEQQEELLAESDLDWTIVQPVGLTNTSRSQTIRLTVGDHPQPRLTISRRSVGKFLVDCVQNDELIGQNVVISAPA